MYHIQATYTVLICLIFQVASAQLTPNKKYVFKAVIGQKIQATVWMSQRDSVITGSIIYQKGKRPIPLRGIQSNGSYHLYEFENTGKITGILSGKLKGKALIGEWMPPTFATPLPLNMTLQQIVDDSQSLKKEQPTDAAYAYKYGSNGDEGYLSITGLSKDSAIIEFNNVTAGPAFNQASIDPVKVPILNNEILYALNENCHIHIRFYSDIAVVEYAEGKSLCSFGMNATVDGIYWKTSK